MLINYIRKCLVSSYPGVISTIISIISIPIYLSINGVADYGNYIFFHFVSSLGFILNLGLGKGSVIQFKKEGNNYLIFRYSIIYTLIIIFFLFIIFFIFSIFNFFNILNLILYLLGIVFTVIYFTTEGIFQSKKQFGYLSLYNLIFFSFSVSLPIIFLLTNNSYNYQEIFFISLLIKILTLIVFGYLAIDYSFFKSNKHKLKNTKLLNLSLWLTYTNIINYIYDYSDKYFIKSFLGPSALAIYSIPQQITSKITLLSKAMSSVLLPDLSENKSNYLFNYSINFIIFFMSPVLMLMFDYFEIIFKIWLNNNVTNEMINLSKIFTISFLFSSISHILVTKFEAQNIIKKNFKIEIFSFPFYIFFVLLCFYFLPKLDLLLIGIGVAIMTKEFLFLLFRIWILKKDIYNYLFKMISIFVIYIFILKLIIAHVLSNI